MKQLLRQFMVLLMAISPLGLMAQQQTVSGTVIGSDTGEPLIGAAVRIEGTMTGTFTLDKGDFSIKVEDTNAALLVSYIGYDEQRIELAGRTSVAIKLVATNNSLDEVIVVGYTTRKRGELTGSVSSVGSEAIERTTNKDLTKSLAGKIPGLIINDRGGNPGSTNDVSILIRGKSTLNNNEPLILIDGVPASSFSFLSPADIESISVLKDGAAAIYGARAANGVILVTTKRGRQGKAQISLSSAYNISSFSARPNLMTSEQYAIYENEIAERNGLGLPFTEEDIAAYAAANDPIRYPSTDWFDETFATSSPEIRNTISIRGGSDKVNYFVSGDHIDQTGVYKSGDLTFKQYQLRSNLDIKLHETFTLGVDLSGRFGDRNQPGVRNAFIYKHIYTNEPTEVAIYPNGLIGWGGENGANPIIMSSRESGFVNRIDNNLRLSLIHI